MLGKPILIISGFLIGLIAAFMGVAFASATSGASSGMIWIQIVPVLLFLVAAALLRHCILSTPITVVALVVPALPLAVYGILQGAGDANGATRIASVAAWLLAVGAGVAIGAWLEQHRPPQSRARSSWMLVGLAWFLLFLVAWRLS